MSVTSGMPRSSVIWQSGSTLIAPPDRASRRLFETRSSKKSGTRLIASIKESRPPAARRRDQLRRPDRAILRSARPCNDAHAARAEILLEHHTFSRQVVPFRLTQSRIECARGDRAPSYIFRPRSSVRFSWVTGGCAAACLWMARIVPRSLLVVVTPMGGAVHGRRGRPRKRPHCLMCFGYGGD